VPETLLQRRLPTHLITTHPTAFLKHAMLGANGDQSVQSSMPPLAPMSGASLSKRIGCGRSTAGTWCCGGSFTAASIIYLYIRKAEGTKTKFDAKWPTRNSRGFLFRDQVRDNILGPCGVAGLIWTGYEILTLWLYANPYIPWLVWSEHPFYFVIWFLLVPLWREFHSY